MKLEPTNKSHVELLAKDLHEAGREAVTNGWTNFGQPMAFGEWEKVPEHVREGRRSQAKWLLAKYRMLVS